MINEPHIRKVGISNVNFGKVIRCFSEYYMNMNKLAILNGNIITINEEKPRAEAVLIYSDKIVKVGSTKEIQNESDADTKILDLQGKTLIPGFVDCHAHPRMYGLSLLRVDCRTPPIKSIEDIIEKISNFSFQRLI